MLNHKIDRRWMRRHRLLALFVASSFVAIVIVPLVAFAADAETEAAYRRQFQALAADDHEGHVKLALWCRDQEAYDLLLKQCKYILKLSPNHVQARLLLDLAKSKLCAKKKDTAGCEDGSGGSTSGAIPGANAAPETGLLSDEQIQILRRAELRLDPPERVTVRFKNDVINRFWEFVSRKEGLGKRDRVAFNKQPPAIKAQQMLAKIAFFERATTEDNPFEDTYSADIVIETDPLIFKTFKTRVWRPIVTGCASAKCHGGERAVGFSLHTGRVMSDAEYYTNFLVLQEYERGGSRLIDRDRPENSLLLMYGLPVASDQAMRHPTKIKPMFRSRRDRKYQTIYAWIEMLKPPTPDYGFSVDDLD